MSGGANRSRPTSMTYPDGVAVNDNYNSGLNDAISQPSLRPSMGKKRSDTNYLNADCLSKNVH